MMATMGIWKANTENKHESYKFYNNKPTVLTNDYLPDFAICRTPFYSSFRTLT